MTSLRNEIKDIFLPLRDGTIHSANYEQLCNRRDKGDIEEMTDSLKEEIFKKLIDIRDQLDKLTDTTNGIKWKVDSIINYLHADIKEQH